MSVSHVIVDLKAAMKTRVTKLLGIRSPIIQAGVPACAKLTERAAEDCRNSLSAGLRAFAV
ncbi:MAG: hypothetical protein Q7V17_21820 [Afipia sp.]|nr:hypothetical protein [Afipia sp.]